MLTLYHAPNSRSSRIIRLIDELGIGDRVDVRVVGIPRQDGSGAIDPANPHPEGKVPLLVHDGVEIRESNAIILYLTDLFPEAGFAPVVGDRDRGRYLSWLAYYGNVVEPVLVIGFSGLEHPVFDVTFRGMPQVVARLTEALETSPYLLGDKFTAADLLLVSPYNWMPDAVPDVPVIRDWLARCNAEPSLARSQAWDRELLSVEA